MKTRREARVHGLVNDFFLLKKKTDPKSEVRCLIPVIISM